MQVKIKAWYFIDYFRLSKVHLISQSLNSSWDTHVVAIKINIFTTVEINFQYHLLVVRYFILHPFLLRLYVMGKCVCLCVRVFTCMQGSEVNLRSSSGTIPHVFGDSVFHWNLGLSNWLSWLVRESQRLAYLYLDSAGIISTYHQHLVCYVVLESNLDSLITNWALFQSFSQVLQYHYYTHTHTERERERDRDRDRERQRQREREKEREGERLKLRLRTLVFYFLAFHSSLKCDY